MGNLLDLLAESRKVLFGRRRERATPLDSERALDILERHGLRARHYLPHLGVDDQELAEACRWLSNQGYVITNPHGALFGRSVAARPDEEEGPEARRALMRVRDD